MSARVPSPLAVRGSTFSTVLCTDKDERDSLWRRLTISGAAAPRIFFGALES